MIDKADTALAYDLGKHAAVQGFESMVAVWMTVPAHLRGHALAVSLAYLQHKINGATHPDLCNGDTAFKKQVQALTDLFDQDLAEQVRTVGRGI